MNRFSAKEHFCSSSNFDAICINNLYPCHKYCIDWLQTVYLPSVIIMSSCSLGFPTVNTATCLQRATEQSCRCVLLFRCVQCIQRGSVSVFSLCTSLWCLSVFLSFPLQLFSLLFCSVASTSFSLPVFLHWQSFILSLYTICSVKYLPYS